MSIEVGIPRSAATTNLILSVVFGVAAGCLSLVGAPGFVVSLAVAGMIGFLLTAVSCALDIQEFRMRQAQQTVELLKKLLEHKDS